jgi:hypothetical protein
MVAFTHLQIQSNKPNPYHDISVPSFIVAAGDFGLTFQRCKKHFFVGVAGFEVGIVDVPVNFRYIGGGITGKLELLAGCCIHQVLLAISQ